MINVGDRFGRLVVLELAERKKYSKLYKVRCDCTNEKIVYGCNLSRGKTVSCGCFHTEVINRPRSHGQRHSRLYSIWTNMKSRCCNPKVSNYKNYGGRGITICKEWLEDYVTFSNWANSHGYDDTLTIERIDVNLGYSPNNCEWIPSEKQQRNKTTSIKLTINNETRCLRDWCRVYNKKYKTFHTRISKGNWSTDKIIEALIT